MDESGYILERSSDGGKTFEFITQPNENIESFTDEDPNLQATVYQYRLKAVNAIGSSAWSNMLTVDISEITGTKTKKN